MAKLEINHLTRQFSDGKNVFTAVDDISFSVDGGTILALLGPNGAGKTTTVQMIGGYLTPTSGEIKINNELYTENNRRLKRHIGVVFGGELGFYGRTTAADNLNFFANLAGLPRKEISAEVERVLSVVELSDVAGKKVQTFSTGMRQRLHIARALLGSPDILLLDEPTSGLDVEIAHEIRALIHKLAENGAAILLTSHTMSEIESLADHILLLGAGKIFHEGTVASIVELSGVQAVNRPATLEESYLALAHQLRRPL